MPLEVIESKVAVGNGTRTDSYTNRNCAACRRAFMDTLRREDPPLSAMGNQFQEELARVDVDARRAS